MSWIYMNIAKSDILQYNDCRKEYLEECTILDVLY